jgi:hypothetical protein
MKKREVMMMGLLSGHLFFGHYLNSSYLDLEDRPVKYRAGIHLNFNLGEDTTLYLEDETLIVDNSDTGFNPGQINYKIGIIRKMGSVDIIFKHECLHPIDGRSGGADAQSYNLVEMRLGF